MLKRLLKKFTLRRLKYIAVVLAAVIIFVTTYALILPAITIDQEQATEESGFYLEEDAQNLVFNEGLPDETGAETTPGLEEPAPLAVEEQTQIANESIPAQVSEEAPVQSPSIESEISDPEQAVNQEELNTMPEEQAAPTVDYPAMVFEAVLTKKTEKALAASQPAELQAAANDENVAADAEAKKQEFRIKAEAEVGTFPAGAYMQVEEASKVASVQNAVNEAVAEEGSVGVKNFHAVNITFYDADGNEIQPLKEIKVTFVSNTIKEEQKTSDKDPVIVHIKDDGKGEVIEKIDEAKLPEKPAEDELTIETKQFSVYAIVYTVDLHYEANGKTYDFGIPGGGAFSLKEIVAALNISTDTSVENFMNNVESVSCSAQDLFWIGRMDADTTVGQIQQANQLAVQYSAELTPEEIGALQGKTIAAGDWAILSLKPFTTEESFTVTMKNGDQFIVQVTDAQEIPDAEKASIDVSKSYLICYEVGGVYYLLKTDGTVESGHHPDFAGDPDSEHDFEHLNSTYAWTFNHIFKEQDVEHHLDKNYYLIRPVDNLSKTLTLNNAGEPLVQSGNNNVAVIQTEDGFILEGYHNIGTEEEHRYIHLGFDNGAFKGVDGEGVTIHVYEMNSLPTYDYTVSSADGTRGKVTVGTQTNVTEAAATTNHDKKNAETITAVPVVHRDTGGRNKWLFDHWELNGLPLDRDEYGATIDTNTLPIPHNGSNLVAYFRQNPNYVVSPEEKEPSSIEDMTGWLEGLQNRNIPLDSSATKKTAEVYDYQNRIYRVDLTSKANFETFAGNLDMAFCLDVSNSMYFPSKLVETTSANRSNPMPIYQINKSGWGWSNQGWLDTSRGWNNPYYLVADASGTATVFKIYYQGGYWKAQDASRETESEKSFRIGEDSFSTNYGEDGMHPFTKGDNDNTTYMIYDAGDNGYNRFHYLNQSLGNGSSDLNTITGLLAVAGDASPNVKIAYNTFNKNLGSQRQNFQNASTLSVNLSNSHGGGTRPDQAFNDAQNFSWTASYNTETGETNRYVILVTDGAPQGVRDDEDSSIDIEGTVRTAATNLKNNSHVKLITVGLSMENVTSGKRLLYDLADFDNNGEKMFYMAESASDLDNIFRQITKVLMENVVVLGDVTDTVGEGFYLVDKATGLPLKAGDTIDIEGVLTTNTSKIAGVVQSDGKTVNWVNQSIDSVAGWHGTVYVKAQEELLGGNAVNTNAGNATVEAKKYKAGGNDIPFDTSLVRDTLKLTAELPSPKVNVNELTFFNNETEWTVYLGENVDPKQQLKALYDSLVVEEVVNTEGGLHYSIGPNTIEERWNNPIGTAKTFSLPGLIEQLIRKDATKTARYFNGSELNWNNFLIDIMSTNGITLPYHEYGLTDGSNIKITLEKTIAANEENDLINGSPHATTITGDEVEKYVLRIAYEPDYTVTPVGQGGASTDDFHTGTFGTMYQGHAAGRESSTNTHVINVYDVPLDVYKTDENNQPLAGATFKLYKVDDVNGAKVDGLNTTHKYVEVATATSGNDGIARLKNAGEDFGLVKGETYYLIETAAPANYTKVNTVWAVEVQTEIGKFTGLDGNTLYSTADSDAATFVQNSMYPFNWDQGARIMLDGETPVTVIAKGETEGTTTTITDGSYVSHKHAISFQHPVVNEVGIISIDVNKEWTDNNDPNRPESIEVQLYRVSEKSHLWGEGTVVPCTCTEEGVKVYHCQNEGCNATDTQAISATGHTPGASHKENEVAATCTEAGGYDTVVRCEVCNAIIGEPQHTAIPAIGHDWGEWTVTTPAQPGIAGVETRVCKNDPSHVETREIPALPVPHTVTVNIYCLGNGSGGGSNSDRTLITTRSGNGIGDMTIEWDWNRWTEDHPFTVEGLPAESSFSTYSTANVNSNTYSGQWENGRYVEKGKRQTLTIHNITQDLVLNVVIDNERWTGTDNSLIYQPTFAGASRSAAASVQRKSLNAAGRSLLNAETPGTGTVLRAESSMSSSELAAYLAGLQSEAAASCIDGADHVYVEEAGTYTVTADDHWNLEIPDLLKYNPYGNEYTYYVVETSPESGYSVTYTGQDAGLKNEGSVTVKNEQLPGSLNITKTVNVSEGADISLADGTYTFEIWNADGTSQITKKADGMTDIGTLQITVTNGVVDPAVLTVDGLLPRDYIIKETGSTNAGTMIDTTVTGYNQELGGIAVRVTAGDTTVPTAAFTNKYETTSATVKKVWDDNNSTNRPTALTVTLVKDGEATEQTVTLSESNDWEDTISNLPKYNNGVEIDYHWLEGDMPAGYFLSHVEKNGTITTLTNTLSQYDLKTSYTGIKYWQDENNKYATRPHELIVTLYADDVALDNEPVWNYDNATGQWTYTFENLPVLSESGSIIHYTAEETVPSGYTLSAKALTPTTGAFGTITYENGADRLTTDNRIIWTLGSLIDMSFVAIKPTANGDVVVWTHRVPTPYEKTAITNAIKNGALPGCSGRNIVFYTGTGDDVYTPHGNIEVTYNQENLSVTLNFGDTSVWSQFIVGQFNKNESSSYNIGTTTFTNTLETTNLSGKKTWTIEGDVVLENPILTLTRTVTTGEGDNAVTSSPEIVTVEVGSEHVPLQPTWSGTGKERTFTYSGLPKYDHNGNEYTYSVAEASFVVGSGADAVTYTAVKATDGTYTVTADKEGADVLSVTQTGNDIVNGPFTASLEIIKVEKGHKDSEHTLAGAKFQLTRVNTDNNNNYSGAGAYQSEVQTVDSSTGKTTFTGLKPGRYKLEEKEAPAGYILPETTWYILIDRDGTATLEAAYELASKNNEGDNSFFIENTPGAELPSAGGIGTLIFYLAGGILALGAAILLIARIRSKRDS